MRKEKEKAFSETMTQRLLAICRLQLLVALSRDDVPRTGIVMDGTVRAEGTRLLRAIELLMQHPLPK